MDDAFYIPKLSSEKLASWTQARATVDGSEVLRQSMGSRVTIDLHGFVHSRWLAEFLPSVPPHHFKMKRFL